ncbi:Regulatory protein AfsR [Micromonospora sp. MH33]|nr:Regulatory protein AfsR [Micromonospora sp. MH33]
MAVRTVRNLEGSRIARPRRRTVEELANALGLTGEPRARLLRTVHGIAPAPAWQHSSLPPVVSDFVGRRAELDQLVAQARCLAEQPGNATVVISGQPGVGKTSLVVRAAHALAAEIPGVACHVDLRGMDLAPLSADRAMEQLLTTLRGGQGGPLPPGPGERLALYRMLTATRPGLLVLDNAATEAQVRPLLPTGPGWLTLVASRFSLGGLESNARLRLTDLDEATATRLIEEIVGADRVSAEPEATAELVRLCTGLPSPCGWPPTGSPPARPGASAGWSSGSATRPAASTCCIPATPGSAPGSACRTTSCRRSRGGPCAGSRCCPGRTTPPPRWRSCWGSTSARPRRRWRRWRTRVSCHRRRRPAVTCCTICFGSSPPSASPPRSRRRIATRPPPGSGRGCSGWWRSPADGSTPTPGGNRPPTPGSAASMPPWRGSPPSGTAGGGPCGRPRRAGGTGT